MAINIPGGLLVPTQEPQDAKLWFKTLAEMINLGPSNLKAYAYYDSMLVMCAEDKNLYIWMERPTTGIHQGMIPVDFIYPSGAIANGVNYSGKSYNFFNYLQYWLDIRGFVPGDVNTGLQFKFKSTLLPFKNSEGEDLVGGYQPQDFIFSGTQPLQLVYKINVFYSEEYKTLNSEIYVVDADTSFQIDQIFQDMVAPPYPGEFSPDPIPLTGNYEIGVVYNIGIKTTTEDGLLISQDEQSFKLVLE